MFDISYSIQHMTWANGKFFEELSALPLECLKAHYGNTDWNVANISAHIVSGNNWYLYLLDGFEDDDYPLPTTQSDITNLRNHLSGQDAKIFENASKPNAEITFDGFDGPSKTSREMVLHQAIYHATEHRTQIATAIEVQGIAKIDLDSYDFWSFFHSQK